MSFDIRGDSTLCGMEIFYASCNSNSFEVITTGARFMYENNELKIYQGLSTVDAPLPADKVLIASCFMNPSGLVLETHTSDRVVIDSDILDIYIFGDSTLIIECKADQEFNVVGYFAPEYEGLAQTSYDYSQNIAELYYVRENKAGGIQVVPERYDIETGYVVQDIYSNSSPSLVNNGENPSGITTEGFYEGEWGVSYYFSLGQRCFINVFPTRPLDYNKWLTSQITHYDYETIYMAKIIDGSDTGVLSYSAPLPDDYPEPPFPTDDYLDTMNQDGSIIMLWYTVLYNSTTSHYGTHPSPKYYFWDISDVTVRPNAVTRVKDFITRAHAKDMKVIFYVSLFYFYGAYGDLDDFCSQIEDLKSEYDMDGIYVDGLACDYVSNDIYPKGFSFIRNWQFMRRMRQLFGEDGVILVHGTNVASLYRLNNSDNIHLTTNIAAMSYATFSYNGEGVTISSLDDFYLKYHTSQYGLSNCFSSLVYNSTLHTIPVSNLAEWMANQYGSHHYAQSYNNPTKDGVTWYYQPTPVAAFSVPFLAEASTMTDPNPENTYTQLTSEESLFIAASTSESITRNIEFNLKTSEECSLVINDTTYVIKLDGNDIIFNYGVDAKTIDMYDNSEWSYSDGTYEFSFSWKGFGSYLFEIDVLALEEVVSNLKNGILFVYNSNSSDSETLAQYYASYRELETTSSSDPTNSGTTGGIDWEVHGQLVGIGITDSSEILSSESSFNTQVLDPLKDAIETAAALADRTILGIILGYSVPGGFVSGSDVVSSTSRISRMFSTFTKKVRNKLYNRSIFKRFDNDDAQFCIICSRIDGPNLQIVKEYIDNAEVLNNQLFANGTFYIDPYSDRAGRGSSEYQDLLLDFYVNTAPLLNLDTWSTSYMDPYIDVAIPFVENDSFVWSWFTERATSSFFQYSNSIRVFFYNADYDGGFEMRNENGKRWPYLAMKEGYVCSAGALSNPTIDGFLNPIPFFNALLRGATIGEAYLFSLPYLDWTISLFGDPLTYCSFPGSSVSVEELTDEYIVWENISKELARIAAYLYKKEKELHEVLYSIVDITQTDPSYSNNADLVTSLLNPANFLYLNNNQKSWVSQIKSLVDVFFYFPNKRYSYYGSETIAPNINTYLSEHGYKISRLLSLVSSSAIIDESNLLDEGWWQFEFEVADDSGVYTNYHFVLGVYSDPEYSNLLLTKDSYDLTSWTYEKEKDNFVPMSFSGVSSSYIGRKVRYTSFVDDLVGINDYLTRGETYYFRVKQYNIETLEEYLPRLYEDIIYT